MFVAPGSPDRLSRRLTRELAQRIASNWWVLLLNGLLTPADCASHHTRSRSCCAPRRQPSQQTRRPRYELARINAKSVSEPFAV